MSLESNNDNSVAWFKAELNTEIQAELKAQRKADQSGEPGTAGTNSCSIFLRLQLDKPLAEPLAGSSLHQAQLLGGCDTSCTELENCLQQELDFQPLTMTATGQPDTVSNFTLSATLPSADNASLTYYLDSQLWPQIVQGAHEFQSLAMDSIDASLRLSAFSMSDEDRARIEQGSLVLLPESFANDWTCLLQFNGIDAQTAVHLDVEQGVLHRLEEEPSVEVDHTTKENTAKTEVWLEQRISTNPDILLQGRKSDAMEATSTNSSDLSTDKNEIPEAATTTSAIQLPDKFMSMEVCFKHSEKICKSSITRVGDGYGILLDTWT